MTRIIKTYGRFHNMEQEIQEQKVSQYYWFYRHNMTNGQALNLAHNTIIYRLFDTITIALHGHDIITYHWDEPTMNYTLILNTHGYTTATTKQRMNQFTPAYIYQKDYDWTAYLKETQHMLPFYRTVKFYTAH